MSFTSMVARAALFAFAMGCPPAAEEAGTVDTLTPVELATVGMDLTQHAPVVLLREPTSGRILPIWVGVSEAESILGVMFGIEMPRPMTHDLLISVIQDLGASVEEVLVHAVRANTYIGGIRLRIGDEEEIREIDSRPSDALALAIRTDAPIRVAEGLLADPPPFDFLAPEADDHVVRILGLTVVAPNRSLRDRHQLPDRRGLVVVGSYGEAADQGIRRGDLIVEVNGQGLRRPMDFLDAAAASGEGPVRVRYWRHGQEREVRLEPQPFPGPEQRRGPAVRV